MINFDFNQNCCGCTACVNSCAHQAIRMQWNEEGFLMPVVEKDKCVDCGLCDKACPHLNTSTDRSQFSLESFKDKCSYLYYSNTEERKQSASGGFVFDVYRKTLKEGGLVCGCVWNEQMEAVHILTDREEDLKRLQSSKYVQSNLQDCYKQIKKALRDGRKVVFCGTPCQTAGLHQYLGKQDRTHLLSVCLICHGIPSPGVWKKWVGVMEKKYNGTLVDVNMRDKSYKGYSTSYVRYSFNCPPARGGRVSGPHTSQRTRNVGMPTYLADPYIFLFTDDLFLRHTCNHCQYKANQNGADIIVGDYYQSTPGAANMGCSCLIAMNEKGNQAIKQLDGTILESDYKTVGLVNSMLWESVDEHPQRENFFKRYKQNTDEGPELLTDYLPFRFQVKKVLNQMGIFNFLRKLLKH